MINGSRLIKELLKSSWIETNTAYKIPNFIEYYEKKRVNGFDNIDEVLVYNRVESENPSSVGNLTRQVINRVCIDLRTDVSDLHVNLMLKEAKRIIRSNVNYLVPSTDTTSTTGQQVIMEIISVTPFSNTESNNTFRNFRRLIELQLTSQAEGI